MTEETPKRPRSEFQQATCPYCGETETELVDYYGDENAEACAECGTLL